jgi:hypothetical protein
MLVEINYWAASLVFKTGLLYCYYIAYLHRICEGGITYMLKPLQKVAAFLLILGLERGRSIIALMDNDEIKTIVPEFERLANLSLEIQESVRKDFQHLGYEDKMKPSEALGVIRLLFNGSKINDKEKMKNFKLEIV